MEGDLIRLLDATTRGKPLGDPGHGHPGRRDHLGKVMSRGLTLDIGAKGQDHLAGPLTGETIQQFRDPQLLGTNPVQRGKFPPKGVIAPAEGTGALKGKNVGRRLDQAKFTA
jgi:hypothetical protein